MNKVAVVGSGGAGKSTFSRELSRITGLPVMHLDALYWKSGWVPTPKEQWTDVIEQLVRNEAWIIDGNYGNTLDARIEAADTIVFLDMPRWIYLYRIVKRRLMYQGKTRPDMANGCNEKLDLAFIKWVWDYPKRRRQDMLRRLERFQTTKRIVVLHSPKEVKAFLAGQVNQ